MKMERTPRRVCPFLNQRYGLLHHPTDGLGPSDLSTRAPLVLLRPGISRLYSLRISVANSPLLPTSGHALSYYYLTCHVNPLKRPKTTLNPYLLSLSPDTTKGQISLKIADGLKRLYALRACHVPATSLSASYLLTTKRMILQ